MNNEVKNGVRRWFREQDKIYFHDLLNDAFFDNYVFNNKTLGYFVEVGVLDGWIHSQSIHFEHIREWEGIVVEPVKDWYSDLLKNRFCNVCTLPISDKREITKFITRDYLAYSHLYDIDVIYGPDEVKSIESVETITLFDLFEKYNSPIEIDFVSIDTEGYELRILNKFFEENTKYKINLISFENHNINEVTNLFKNKPYTKIKNPYHSFLKFDYKTNLGILRLANDNNFYNYENKKYEGKIIDLKDIDFEHYYIHNEYLQKNLHLIDFIIK